jgi:hypothetical protein
VDSLCSHYNWNYSEWYLRFHLLSTENTLSVHYYEQPVNILRAMIALSLRESYEMHKYIFWRKGQHSKILKMKHDVEHVWGLKQKRVKTDSVSVNSCS